MEYTLTFLTLLLFVSGISTENTTDSRYGLTIVGLLPMTGRWPGGAAILAATQLALEHVNSRQDILPDYKMQFVYKDTRVRSVSSHNLHILPFL